MPRIAALVLLCAFFPAAGASTTGTQPASAGQGNDQQDVLRATLDNGLRVVVVRDPLAPVVTTMVNYLVGSNETPKGFPGMAHAQEHMMFRGNPGLSGDQLADIAAAMGGDFDADTRQTVTQYEFSVPAAYLDLALHIESIRMRGVLDSEKLWRTERGAIEQEVASDLSSPEYVLYTKVLLKLFRGTPYAHDALGTRASFDDTTAKMLKRFHDTWYAPNNAVLVVAGDVQPAHALAEIKRLFGDIPRKKLPARPRVHLQPVAGGTLSATTDSPTGQAMVVFRMPGASSADYAAAQILSDVLSSRRGVLYRLVTEGKALDAGFDLDTLPEAGIGFAAAEFPKGHDGAALASEVRKAVSDAVAKGIPADLVEAAKRQERTAAETRKNSVSGLASLWSDAVAVEGRSSPEEDIRAIEQVTPGDVNRLARDYLGGERAQKQAVVAVLTPQASGAPAAARHAGGKESFTPRNPQRVKLPAWARHALGRLAVPASAVHPVVSTLPDGLRLIVQPESVSDTVSVRGHVRNRPAVEEPSGQEGVDSVLDRLFDYGTTDLDRLAFQKALDDIGAQESAGTDFSLDVLSGHLDRGVQLLADNELHPALPAHDFEIVRRQVAASAGGLLHSPDHLAHQALKAALFPKGDPSLRETRPKTVSSLTLGDVRAYYHKVFRPDLTTIVVIGNVRPDEAKRVIEKYFGDWQAEGPKPGTELPSVPPNAAASTTVPDASRVQDRVILAETLGLTRDNPDYYALQLGNHVLGGAFYATRLYRELRERTGLVYYVGSSIDAGKTRAIYEVGYGCDPDNVSRAKSMIGSLLKDMRRTPVSAHELRQAKAELLREIPLSEASTESIADGLLHRAALDLPLDEPVRAAHRYVALTADQVRHAFHKYLRPGALIEVTQGPQPQ